MDVEGKKCKDFATIDWFSTRAEISARGAIELVLQRCVPRAVPTERSLLDAKGGWGNEEI